MAQQSEVAIRVRQGDALRITADALVLKHAHGLYGADRAAFLSLAAVGVGVDLPALGSHAIVESSAALGATQVVFLGVEPLHDFSYREIRAFGHRSMSVLAIEQPGVRHVALTIHGPGYGLDETEAFESELAGVVDAIKCNEMPVGLETVTFVELDQSRAQRLRTVLARLLPGGKLSRQGRGPFRDLDVAAESALRSAGRLSASKPRVFVAMPFADEMSDIFHYGIQGAVNEAGLLAERADLASFTGDVMEWVRARITTANLVIADLTAANPNVFLEIGYAWGKGVPTVLIARDSEVLKFDVRGQKCILYKSIKDLQDQLQRELVGLLATSGARIQ